MMEDKELCVWLLQLATGPTIPPMTAKIARDAATHLEQLAAERDTLKLYNEQIFDENERLVGKANALKQQLTDAEAERAAAVVARDNWRDEADRVRKQLTEAQGRIERFEQHPHLTANAGVVQCKVCQCPAYQHAPTCPWAESEAASYADHLQSQAVCDAERMAELEVTHE